MRAALCAPVHVRDALCALVHVTAAFSASTDGTLRRRRHTHGAGAGRAVAIAPAQRPSFCVCSIANNQRFTFWPDGARRGRKTTTRPPPLPTYAPTGRRSKSNLCGQGGWGETNRTNSEPALQPIEYPLYYTPYFFFLTTEHISRIAAGRTKETDG